MTSSEETQASHRRVLILHHDESVARAMAQQFASVGILAAICDRSDTALAAVYNDPPDLIVVHSDLPPDGGVEVARALKRDNVFAHLPVLLLAPKDALTSEKIEDDCPFDDYMDEAASVDEVLARARLCILRAHRQLDANPLTRLPGNNSIFKELEGRLARRDPFATVYIDLDNFKAFNDRYGFARGDEALRLTARLTVSCVSAGSPKDYYVGHVGGDDFIFIVPIDRTQVVCEQLITNFDALIRSLYDDEERREGCIHSVNRKGEREVFPLMTISLAVAQNTNGQFGHPGEISVVAAELKKIAKRKEGSNYVVDQRDQSGVKAPSVDDA